MNGENNNIFKIIKYIFILFFPSSFHPFFHLFLIFSFLLYFFSLISLLLNSFYLILFSLNSFSLIYFSSLIFFSTSSLFFFFLHLSFSYHNYSVSFLILIKHSLFIFISLSFLFFHSSFFEDIIWFPLHLWNNFLSICETKSSINNSWHTLNWGVTLALVAAISTK